MKSALLKLHLVVFLWGFTAIIGKLISSAAPSLVFYRMSLASLILFIFTKFFFKKSLHVPRKLLLQLLLIGACMAVHWMCFFHSIKISNVSIALSCLSCSTLFAALLEPLIFKRKIDYQELAAGFLIMLCVGLIFKVEFRYWEGIVFGIVTALFGTIFSVFNGKIFGKTSSENIIFYELFGGTLLVVLFHLFVGNISDILQITIKDFAWVFLLASVFTAYPMLESIKLMKYISPFTLILTVNLEPVYGILFAFYIFGDTEHMNPAFYLSAAVMIGVIFANAWLKSKKKNTLHIENSHP